MEQFSDVVDQVVIFLFICASITGAKSHRLFRDKFVRVVSDNDVQRREKWQILKTSSEHPGQSAEVAYFAERENEDRWQVQERDVTQRISGNRPSVESMLERVESCRSDAENEEAEMKDADELALLYAHQVMFNFSKPEGIMLFRKMRLWMRTQSVNEAFETEMFMVFGLLFIFAAVTSMAWCYVGEYTVTGMALMSAPRLI